MKIKLGRQYWLSKKDMLDINGFVDTCVGLFVEKCGYKPSVLAASQDVIDQLKARKDLDYTCEKVQRRNIRLYEVVLSRQPRVAPKHRTPVRS